jgi:hypothetical protein
MAGTMTPQSQSGWLRRGIERNASVVVVLILWELTTRTGVFNNFLLPPLSNVLWRGGLDILNGELPRHALATGMRAFVGFGLAAIVGVAAGTLMSMSAAVRRIMEPLVSVAFPIPKIAFMPIFILWFGLDDLSKTMMIAFTCVVPIVSATFLGTTTVDKYFLWSWRLHDPRCTLCPIRQGIRRPAGDAVYRALFYPVIRISACKITSLARRVRCHRRDLIGFGSCKLLTFCPIKQGKV